MKTLLILCPKALKDQLFEQGKIRLVIFTFLFFENHVS